MDCHNVQQILLSDDGLSVEGFPRAELSNHIAQCEDCRRLQSDLARLDEEWRAIPLPASAEQARDDFLARLSEPTSAPAFARRRRFKVSRWLIAASILVALGLGGGLFVAIPRAEASADVVERLVDWNLSLARASAPEERNRILADHASDLSRDVRNASLPTEDKDLAEALLANAPWLARNADPLAEADHFNELANKLFKRLSRASRGGDARRVAQSARLYSRVVELGIESKMDVIERSGALDFERQRRLERLILSDSDRMNALVALLERAPDSSRKEIRRALKITNQRPNRAAERRAEKKNRKSP